MPAKNKKGSPWRQMEVWRTYKIDLKRSDTVHHVTCKKSIQRESMAAQIHYACKQCANTRTNTARSLMMSGENNTFHSVGGLGIQLGCLWGPTTPSVGTASEVATEPCLLGGTQRSVQGMESEVAS